MDNDKRGIKDEYKKINYNRAISFFEEKTLIHVECGKSFYNGRILEYPTKDFFILHDRKIGAITIFYDELTRKLIAYVEEEK